MFLPDFVRRSISFHAAGARSRARYSAPPPRPRSIRSASLTKHAAAHPSFIATKARSRSECSTMDDALAAADLTGPRGSRARRLRRATQQNHFPLRTYKENSTNIPSSTSQPGELLAASGLPGQGHGWTGRRRGDLASHLQNGTKHEQAGESRMITRRELECSGLNRTESGNFWRRQSAALTCGIAHSERNRKVTSRYLPPHLD